MKMFFEEPELRVEKFTAESVMSGAYHFTSFVTFDAENDRTHGIFARPF